METIYLPDNLHAVIKLERLADSDAELEDAKPAGERTKMGEIFQTTRDHLTFVCTHCSAEFTLFIQFTSHIEQHLKSILSVKVEAAMVATTSTVEDSSDKATMWNDTETANTVHWAETISNRGDSSEESEPNEPIDDSTNLETINEESQEKKNETNFDCPQCGRHLKNPAGLKLHLTRMHSNEKYQCTLCHKIHTTLATFTKHVKNCKTYNYGQKQSNREIPDINCGATENSSFQRYTNDIDSTKSFECFQCHEPLSTQIECKVHVQNHLNAETTCEHCARTIKTNVSNRLHRRYCKPPTVQDAPADCPVCNQTFPSYGRYFVHAREDHGLTAPQMRHKRKTKCGRCSLQFNTRMECEKHLETHKTLHHIRKHTCNLCGKMYRNYSMYRLHMQRHEGKGLFKCEICANTYAKYYRNEHMKSHSSEKKFQCNECGALWTSMQLLKSHMKIHTNVKPHECEFCQKRFRKSYNLKVHRRLHTGEYVHYCKSCEKGYTDKNGLNKHNLKVHGVVAKRDGNISNRQEIW